MKSAITVLGQRLVNMQAGMQTVVECLAAISKMLMQENSDIEFVKEEIEEIREFMMWLKGQ